MAINIKREFLNPDNLPLEQLCLSVTNAGVVQNVKALNTFWVEKKELIVYERPPTGVEMVRGALEAWKTKAEVYLSDLKWLLALEHHRFWSTIIYHPQCMDSLVSFLQEASPPYLPPHECKDIQKLYEEIRRLILVIFSRLITNKESKECWISKEYMSGLIYDNFVFTIPIIWDICLTYGVDNSQHVSRLVSSVFTLQPKYENDASAAISFVNEAFKFIILQVNHDYGNEEPPNLPETFKGFTEIKRPTNSNKATEKLTFEILKDLVIHLLDTAMTLRTFIEVYPNSVKIFRKNNFVNSIVQLYEYGVPQLYEKLLEVGDPTSVAYSEVEGYIDAARVELIDIFREILAVYKNAIFSGEGSISSHVEDFLSVMMDGLSERLLLQDYHASYPVSEDLEMLRQAYPDIDPVKTDFILQAIYSNLEDPESENLNHRQITNGHIETIDNEPTTSKDNEIPQNIRQESLISEVKDILPHLGDGFILKCLEHYGFQPDRVINSILEDNLAQELRGIDQSLPVIPPDPVDTAYLNTGIQRLNVFDGDEFDIMSRDDVDVSRIHLGKKKSKYRDMRDMLDDKEEVRQRIDIYSKYNLVCDSEAMYSDEYDDTYDSDGGGAPAGDSSEQVRRPLVTPRVLQTRPEIEEESSSEEETVEEAPGNSRHKLDFCVNPEVLRERREAARAARGRGRDSRPPPSQKKTDVTGKPKGQGQDKDVLHNRDKKEKHKSARANHNRRQGAQFKRSQGMMPS